MEKRLQARNKYDIICIKKVIKWIVIHQSQDED
jgi:hypothetical protein